MTEPEAPGASGGDADSDARIYARYGAWYMRCGPMHLSTEACAAIERHLRRLGK